MKFENFSNTEEPGKRSDYSDTNKKTIASEASIRDASGLPDKESLRKAIKEINVEIEANNSRIAQLQVRQAELNRRVKGGGASNRDRFLPRKEYQDILKEQNDLAGEAEALRSSNADLKVRMSRLKADLIASDKEPYRLDLTNALLKQILIELKKINSTRGT